MFKKVLEQPLNYWEEFSYMSVILPPENTNFIKNCLDRISSIPNLEIENQNFDVEKGITSLRIHYEKEIYEISFYLNQISVQEFYLNQNFFFTEEEKEKIKTAQKALTIFMKFYGNNQKCYQLQLKLAVAVAPDFLAVLDESAEKILPAKWVLMTANSKLLPNPTSLFSVQAINNQKKEVWLHTHGLCRCGMRELEILASNENNYQNHYQLLVTYALYLLDQKHGLKCLEEGALIGCLTNGNPIIVTSKPWIQGIKEYKSLTLGHKKDRKNSHNTKSNILFLCPEEGKIQKLSVFDNKWGDNPLFLLSEEETKRMKELAIERFDYVKKAFQNKNNKVLLKIGLPLEEKGKFEHIWFELLEIKENKMKAKLTQEPFEAKNIKVGEEAWYKLGYLTDWIIYTDKFSISPDNAYLLEY